MRKRGGENRLGTYIIKEYVIMRGIINNKDTQLNGENKCQ